MTHTESAAASAPRRYTQIVALVISLMVTLSWLVIYALLYQRHSRAVAPVANRQARELRQTAPPPAAQVLMDATVLHGAQALLGGSVRNLSSQRIEDLSLVLELTSRDGQRTAQRVVRISPTDLAPNEAGRYALSVPAHEWAQVTLVALHSRHGEIAFRGEMGAPPPLSQTNAPVVRAAPARGARPPVRDDESINTPDTAVTIR